MNYSHSNSPILYDYHFRVYRRPIGYAWNVEFSLDENGTDKRWATGTCPTKAACFDRAAEYRQYVLRELEDGN